MKRLQTKDEAFDGPDSSSFVESREALLGLATRRETLANSFDELLGDGGPSDETADEMIVRIREWRDIPSSRSLD